MTTSTAGKPLDLAQFEGHTPDSKVAAIRLAIEDHKAGKLIDWQFVDSLNAAIPDLYATAALRAECHRQREEIAAMRLAMAQIVELTFQDAVNGHLNSGQTITPEQIGEVYEIASAALGRQE